MKIVWHWLILSLAIYATSIVMHGQITIDPPYIVLIVGACLMFVNLIIKPVIAILTLPINIVTLGILGIIFNGGFFWLMTDVVHGFRIESFQAAVIGACIVSVINWILEKIF